MAKAESKAFHGLFPPFLLSTTAPIAQGTFEPHSIPVLTTANLLQEEIRMAARRLDYQ